MKKWIGAGVVAAVLLIVFAAPAVVGGYAEQEFRNTVATVNAHALDFKVKITDYDQGWLESVAHVRVINVRHVRHFPAQADFVWTLYHGPFTFTRWFRDDSVYRPVLAIAEMHAKVGQNDAPASLVTVVGFGGTPESKLKIGTVRYNWPPPGEARMVWEGLDATLTPDKSMTHWRYHATIGELTANAQGGGWTSIQPGVSSGTLRFESQAGLSPEDVSWSTPKLQLGQILLTDVHGKLRTAIADGRIDWLIDIESSKGRLQDFTFTSLKLSEALRRFGIEPIIQLESQRNAAWPAKPPFALLRPHLEALLRTEPVAEIKQFHVVTPDGDIDLNAALTFHPVALESEDTVWQAVMKAATGTGRLTVDRSYVHHLVDVWAQQYPDKAAQIQYGSRKRLQAWLRDGYITRDGDSYSLNAGLANGQLTVNGHPVSLPKPKPGPAGS